MENKFMTHGFKKICSEPRGTINDALIVVEIKQNRKYLNSLANDRKSQWINNIVDVSALLHAFDVIEEYYTQGSVSDELWTIASFYAFKYCESLDKEISSH